MTYYTRKQLETYLVDVHAYRIEDLTNLFTASVYELARNACDTWSWIDDVPTLAQSAADGDINATLNKITDNYWKGV